MAIQLVVLGLLFALMIGSFILALLTEHKVFLVASFLLLMFSGVLVQSAGGVIIGHYYDEVGALAAIIVTLDDPVLYLFSQFCFWIGVVVSAWLGLVAAFGYNKTAAGSPFSW